jgi:hypothetical protein
MNTQEPTQQIPPSTDTGEVGSLDAAALAFETREQPEAADDQADTEVEAQDDDPDAEADDGDSDEDTDEPEALAEVEFEGKTYKVPPELEKALLRQSDYSRKMNEVATKEKVYTQRIEQAETLVQGAEKLATALAEVNVIDARLKQYESVNWQQLRVENPGEFAAHASELQMLRLSRQEAAQRAQMVGREVSSAKEHAVAEARAEMFQVLGKTLKGWGDEMGQKLTAYAGESGIKLETLNTITDPGLVVALEKARKFDELQKSKPQLKAKAQAAPPVLKPGVPRKASPNDDAMANLRKHRTQDAAEAAFFSRMR